MTGMAFLLIVVVGSVVGSMGLWLHYRRPTSMHSGIDDFNREMDALSPDGVRRRRRSRQH